MCGLSRRTRGIPCADCPGPSPTAAGLASGRVSGASPHTRHPSLQQNSGISHQFSLNDTLAPVWVTAQQPHVSSHERASYSLDAFHEWIYRETQKLLQGFCELDAWSMIASRPGQASTDGIHATGIVSQWFSSVVLNAIAQGSCAQKAKKPVLGVLEETL